MSVFTSLVTETIAVPGMPPGQTVTVRKLAPRALAEAARVQQMAAVVEARRMQEAMGAEMFETVSRVKSSEIKALREADPVSLYDRVSLMSAGVVSWTLERVVGIEAFEDLDDDTQDWLATAILRLSKPALFRSEAEQETDQKNGSGRLH